MNWKLLILITVLCWASYNVILKAISGRVVWHSSMIAFVFGYFITVLLYCILDKGFKWDKLANIFLVWPIICGILCGIGAITFFRAIPLTAGSVLLSLVGLYVPISAIMCLLFLGEPISLKIITGIVCAGVAVLLLS